MGRFRMCDGMTARILYSQCLQDNFLSETYEKDLKDIFNFIDEISKDDKNVWSGYPSLYYVDCYGHTAFDGLSFNQLVDDDLPRLKQLALTMGQHEIAQQIDDFLRFIDDTNERSIGKNAGDHWMIVFDGL